MKKILFTILLAVVALSAPLKSVAEFRYTPQVGVSFTNLKFKQDLFDVKGSTGFSVGILGEMMFPGIGFGVDIGLGYEMLGASTNLGQCKMWASQGYGDPRIYLHYLRIPLHLRYKHTRLNGLEDYIAPFAFVGPSFGIRMANSKCDAYDFSGGDLSIDFGAGFELFRNWQISGCYTMGLTYALEAKILQGFSARNSSWNIRLAYFF